MKSKKLMSLLLAGFMVVGLLAGCGSSEKTEKVENAESTESAADNTTEAKTESTSEGDIQITVFHRFSDGESKQFFDEAAASFEEAHPGVKVVMTSADNANYKQEISVKLASNESPDIYFAWSGVYAQNFADGGRALDLSSYISGDKAWSEGIIANQFGPFTFDGKIYGIPIVMDGKAFYYNKEIFSELNLQVPETWEDFMTVLDAISKTDYIPISLGNQEDWATGHYMTTLNQRMVSADTLAADYAMEGDFSDAQYVEALKRLNEMTPYFTPDFNSTSYDTGINDFITGKAAIYYEQFNQVQYIQPAEFEWSWL